jgi:hypothetical protein
MVMVVKSEWHQVEKRFELEVDELVLQEIYPEKEEDEIDLILKGLEDGTYDIDDVMNEADENMYDLDWEYVDEDWWTERKGGYDITYEIVGE